MLLLLQHKDNISGIRVWVLIGHFPELDLVVVRRALLDVHLKDLSFLLRLEGFALTAAGVALGLHLLDHWSHTHHLNLDSTAIARFALLHALLLVDDLTGDGHLLRGTSVHLLESDLEILHYILGLLALPCTASAAAAASTEEGLEDVSGITSSTLLEAFLAVLVVLGTLVGIAQHLVGASDLLELFRITALVRVVLHGKLPVGLLDFGIT
mmetsp:Transcript_77784/g.137184  ORF Transcript_77784/g.137184 Transcript_77784/m.137184 type:complete len:211 (-) Transcript_77784:209-841(-)